MNKEQIQKIALEMLNEVDLNGRHQYIRNVDAKKLAGVSSISGLLPQDWAIPYGAKEAVKALGYFEKINGEENLEEWQKLENILNEIKGMDGKEFYKFLHEAKKAHARRSDKALEDGTIGHLWVEKFVKAKIRNQSLPELPKDWLAKPLQNFIDWSNENVDEFLLSEARLHDIDNEYCGTLDILAVVKGQLAIVDAKFANHIGIEYYLQIAGYANALMKRGIKIDKRIIVRLPKTEFLTEWDNFGYKKIKNEMEVLEVPTDLSFDIETFLHLRQVEKWWNYAKKFTK